MKLYPQAILGCLLLIGCGPAEPAATEPAATEPAATEADVAVGVFGSPENMKLIKAAKKLTACRLKQPPDDAYDGSPSDDQILGMYKEGAWIECSPSQVERLRQVLVAPRTYVFDIAKSCFPRYGVRVRFAGEDEAIDVNFCFECKVLVVVRDGKIIGGEDFDGGNRELVAICKELFPNDSEIQALKR